MTQANRALPMDDNAVADMRQVRQQLDSGYRGPFLRIDSAVRRDFVRRFRAALPRVALHFAVK